MKTTASPAFFNVNGVIGRGAYETPDFPNATAFAAHLDYLGIERSLVWHVAARDQNPTLGNRQLLDVIADTGLQDRLLPAFVITPACFFEYGALAFLRAQCRSGAVRALRLTPEVSRFPIRQIERVLAELAPFLPVILWDCRHHATDQNMRDFEAMAQRFPGLPFVATQKMWGGFGSILDLMWRCPNVHVDTSWLHMRDTIEMLTETFGVERVLFGIGPKAHYGAAIAALAHARLDASEREAIAHRNIERLLRLPPYRGAMPTPPALLNDKPLWQRSRTGMALEDIEIIDAHGHSPPHARGWVIRRNTVESGIKEVLERMDSLGIDRLILSPESALFGENLANNRETEHMLERHRDRIAGYLVYNPLYGREMAPNLDDFFSRDFFVGFKLLAAYWQIPMNDPGYEPVWDYAHRHRLPILMHTWEGSTCSPAILRDIVRRYPDAFYLLGHAGGGTQGRLEAEALALEHPTVYLEFCGSFTASRPFETSLEIVGPDRVVFGSDTAAHDPAWELGRYLSMPLPDDKLIPGLSANMNRILAARR